MSATTSAEQSSLRKHAACVFYFVWVLHGLYPTAVTELSHKQLHIIQRIQCVLEATGDCFGLNKKQVNSFFFFSFYTFLLTVNRWEGFNLSSTFTSSRRVA